MRTLKKEGVWVVGLENVPEAQYYRDADLSQIRTEIGYVSASGRREFGYFGAYGARGDLVTSANNGQFRLEPTNMHAFYYRRWFKNDGYGRLWAGFTSEGDGLVGADLRVPVGKSWALENRLNYLIPWQEHGLQGLREESWGLTIQLVWYPGRSAQCAQDNRFRPLFNVADNSLFMVDAF